MKFTAKPVLPDGAGYTNPDRLPVPGNTRYILQFHPSSWDAMSVWFDEDRSFAEQVLNPSPKADCVESKFWLPQLGALILAPGANLIIQRKKRMDKDKCESLMRRLEWQEIPLESHPSGSYMHSYDAKKGTTYYCEIFKTPEVVGKKVYWSFDHNSYRIWLLSMIEQGRIPEMNPYIGKDRKAMMQVRIDRVVDEQHKPSGLKRMHKAEEQLAVMEFAESIGDSTPKIPRKRVPKAPKRAKPKPPVSAAAPVVKTPKKTTRRRPAKKAEVSNES